MLIKKNDKIIINYIINNNVSVLTYIYVAIASFASIYFLRNNDLTYFKLINEALNTNIFIGILLFPVITLQVITITNVFQKDLLVQQRFLNKKDFSIYFMKIILILLLFILVETILFLLVYGNIFGLSRIIFSDFIKFIYFVISTLLKMIIFAFITIFFNMFFNKINTIIINSFLGVLILFNIFPILNKMILFDPFGSSLMLSILNCLIMLMVIYLMWKLIIFLYKRKMFEGVYK